MKQSMCAKERNVLPFFRRALNQWSNQRFKSPKPKDSEMPLYAILFIALMCFHWSSQFTQVAALDRDGSALPEHGAV